MPDSAPITPEIMGPDEQLPLTARPAAAALAGGPAPADPGPSRVGQIFHSVLDTLSGGQSEPAMNDKGAIAEQPVTRTGGEWARRLLAGAFTGLASGAAAPVRPGAGALAGLGAGFAGETAQLEKQDVEKRQQLQKNFENEAAQKQAGNEDLLRKAQTAYLTTQNTSLGFQLARSKAEATDKAVESFNAFEKTVGAAAGSHDLGTFPDLKAVLAYQKEHPELTHQIAGHPSVGGQLYVSPALAQDEEGNWTYQGVRAAFVPQDVLNQTISQVFGDKPVPGIPYFAPGKMKADGTQEPGTWQTVPPANGTRYGDYLSTLQKSAADAGRENSALAAQQIQTSKAQQREANATAGKTEEETSELKEGGGKAATEQGKAFDRAAATSAQKDVDTARGADFRWRSMAGSLDAIKKSGGKDQQAMLNLLTNHIGMTLGMQKGARITKDILNEAQKSTPFLQGLAAKFSGDGYLTGVTLTPDQMNQMMGLAVTQRANAWAQAIEAARQGGVADRLKIPPEVEVRVKHPDGTFGTIPAARLADAEDHGYEVAPQ